MKHDWADIKFREPQLIQEKSLFNGRIGFYNIKLKRSGFYFPTPPIIKHNPSAPNRKSAGIETAIKELKDLFCNSFKRK